MSADVATVGDNCIDRYLPPVDRSLVGGNALNVAAGLRCHGREVVYVGAVGDDDHGRAVLDAAAALGIDLEQVRVVPGRTGVTTVRLGPGGEREFVEEMLGTSENFVPSADALERLAGCAWVHGTASLGVDGSWIADLAADSVRVSYDFSHPHDRSRMAALCPHLEVAFLSLPAGHPQTGLELARAVSALGARATVVTLGAAGSVGVTGGTSIHQPALEVETVDTLGAGDAYVAGTVNALLAGADLDQAMSAGTADAASACRHLGAWPNQPISTDEEMP